MSIFSYLPSHPGPRMPRSTQRPVDPAIHWKGPILQGKATVRDAIHQDQPASPKSGRPLVQLPFRFH